MGIRVRRIDGHLVALCAAESEPQEGDLYLDEEIHGALLAKFREDTGTPVAGSAPGSAVTVDEPKAVEVPWACDRCGRGVADHDFGVQEPLCIKPKTAKERFSYAAPDLLGIDILIAILLPVLFVIGGTMAIRCLHQ